MFYGAGESYYGAFTTQATTGVAKDADKLPVAVALRNGAADAGFVLTAAKLDTGLYSITGTVPADYADGDRVQIVVAATVGGTAGKAVVDAFQVGEPAAQEDLEGLKRRLGMGQVPVRRGTEQGLPVAGNTIAGGDSWTSESLDLRPYAGGLLEVVATVAADQAAVASVNLLGSGDGLVFESVGSVLGAMPLAAGAQVVQFLIPASSPFAKIQIVNPGADALTAVTVRWWPVLEA